MIAVEWILSRAWALDAASLDALLAVAAREGDALKVLEARDGRPLEGARRVTTRGGTAIVPVRGTISRYANWFTEVCDATSVELLARDFTAAADDPSVRSIVLEIDSPGGEASGIGEMAAMIAARRGEKPVVAYVSDKGASGAYWLASAADRVVAAPSAQLGSIGVVMGVRTRKPDGVVEIVSSGAPRKRPDPATDEGLAAYRERVDALERVFVGDVARYRGVAPETVLADFGRGGLLIAEAAVAAGMADGLGTLEGLLADLNDPGRRGAAPVAARMAAPTTPAKGNPMSTEADGKAVATDPAAPTDVASHPKFLEMQRKLDEQAAAMESVKAEARASREKAFRAEAETFFAEMVGAARALPAERDAFVAACVRAAIDDHEHPAKLLVKEGGQVAELTRVEALKASARQRPQHNLFAERAVSDPASLGAGLRRLDHGPDGDDRARKDVEFARSWAENGALGAKV